MSVTAVSTTSEINSPLGPAEIQPLHQEGFLVVSNALNLMELTELRLEATAICRGEREDVEGVETIYSDATDSEVLRQNLYIPFPHKISAVMESYWGHPAIADTLKKFIGPNVKCMQSKLFVKASGMPAQAWHQDEYFIPTHDCSLNAAWIALDDATNEDGHLWVIPGSHVDRLIWH